jgi:hypothetical protein
MKYISCLLSLSLLFYSCATQQNRHQKNNDLRTRAYHAEHGKLGTKKIRKKSVQSSSSTLDKSKCQRLKCFSSTIYLTAIADADTYEQAEMRAKSKLAAMIQSEVKSEIINIYKETKDDAFNQNKIINQVSVRFKYGELIKTVRSENRNETDQVQVIAYLNRKEAIKRLNRDFQVHVDDLKFQLKDLVDPRISTENFIGIWQGVHELLDHYYLYLGPYYSIAGHYPKDHTQTENQLKTARQKVRSLLAKSRIRISITDLKTINTPLALLIKNYFSSKRIRSSLSGRCPMEGYDLILKGTVKESIFSLTNKPMKTFIPIIQVSRCKSPQQKIHHVQLPAIRGIARNNRTAEASLIQMIQMLKYQKISDIKSSKRQKLNREILKAVQSSIKGLLPVW